MFVKVLFFFISSASDKSLTCRVSILFENGRLLPPFWTIVLSSVIYFTPVTEQNWQKWRVNNEEWLIESERRKNCIENDYNGRKHSIEKRSKKKKCGKKVRKRSWKIKKRKLITNDQINEERIKEKIKRNKHLSESFCFFFFFFSWPYFFVMFLYDGIYTKKKSVLIWKPRFIQQLFFNSSPKEGRSSKNNKLLLSNFFEN